MSIQKEQIISSNNLDEVFGRFLLGDFIIIKTYPRPISRFYGCFNIITACIDSNNLDGESHFSGNGLLIEIIPNIELSKIYEPTSGKCKNLIFKESENEDDDRLICGPFYFSKEYMARLFKIQFGYNPK